MRLVIALLVAGATWSGGPARACSGEPCDAAREACARADAVTGKFGADLACPT